MGCLAPQAATCATCRGQQDSLCSALSAEHAKLVEETRVWKHYEAGDVLFREGEACRGIYCIFNGLVGIRKSGQRGGSIMLARLGHAGTILGYRPFLAGEPNHRGTAEAIKPSSVCFIEGAVVSELLNASTSLRFKFLKQVSYDLAQAHDETVLQQGSVQARLLHLIAQLKDRYGFVRENGDIVVDLPFSRDDIAHLISIHPESVTRAFRHFRKSGALERFGHRVVVYGGELDFSNVDYLSA